MTEAELLAGWTMNEPTWIEEIQAAAEHLGVTPGELVFRALAALPGDAPTPTPAATIVCALREVRIALDALRHAAPGALVTVPQAAEALGVPCPPSGAASGSIPSRRLGRSVRVDLSAMKGLDRDEVARLAREARVGR